VVEGERVGRVALTIGDRLEEVTVNVTSRLQGLSAEVRRVPSPGPRAREAQAPARGALGPGRRIGHYRVLAEIGRGAVGVVYRAEHVSLQKAVALKILRPELAGDPGKVARFLNEARASSRVQQPGLVATTDFGTTADGLTYLVMELVESPTLAELLARGPLSPERAVAIARSLAEALEAPHEAGIVHRDLKPANIFVGPMDRAKIADFGSAKLTTPVPDLNSDTLRGVWCGTPLYMSPEHGGGVSTDRRSDLYALGCIFFEMLTGRVPYDGSTAVELVIKHARERIPRAEVPTGRLPLIFQKTLQRALAKDPRDRYQNARAFLADLDRCEVALERKGWRAWLPA
jgi:serine/threonine protein kinase